jgi:hypothetical protein
MRELLESARVAQAEGLEAHRAGGFDTYQEKLEEARAWLAELEEVWLEEVVAHMPGADDWDRDAVANEHFGEIWGEVDPVKAAVRKSSALR